MESDLLIKEDEFYKENEKLEQRTKELMRKVNDVMKIQDNLIKETLKTKTEMNNAKINNYNFSANTEYPKFLDSSGDCVKHEENPGVPNAVDAMGRKGASHFYRAKIKSMQAENVKLYSENKKKIEDVKKLQKENQTLLEEKEKMVSALNSKLQSKDCEVASVRKEIDQVRKELKNSNMNLNSSEIRLNRAYEENEKLKESLKSVKEEEKEMKELYRKQINDLQTTVKQIEKHKLELINGFKKQLQLINILKKQKIIQMDKSAKNGIKASTKLAVS
ncbi:hypothetical protein NQ318_023299 [Aromia moschata]|uniref:Uncharacterized protein n=1 Tax=Aromia moschata TaxID=1265417 RepID=A0AAV8XTV8_9CUCU|nr:hypothetical protein NQ318_023299 [Aromia moschata]